MVIHLLPFHRHCFLIFESFHYSIACIQKWKYRQFSVFSVGFSGKFWKNWYRENWYGKYFYFQTVCTITDINFLFLMQPFPLFPLMSAYCVGFLAKYFDVWSHYLIALLVGMIVAQLESLAYCFVRKHQIIANITKRHLIPKNVNDAITMISPFFPIFGYMAFCNAGMKREDQMGYVRQVSE